jgi:hypothetical protein
MNKLDYEDMFPRRPHDSFIIPGHQKHNHDGQPVSTGKAVLWVLPDGQEEWFPRQQIIEHKQDALLITTWLAEKKGWNKNTNWEEIAENNMYEEAAANRRQEEQDARYAYDADYDDEVPF